MNPRLLCFYDIDTPVTLARLDRGEEEYLAARQIAAVRRLLLLLGRRGARPAGERRGARRAVPLYCSVDADALPADRERRTLGPWLSRHLQPRPAADARGAADRAGAAPAGSALRRGRAAISRRHRLARQCRAHRASAPGATTRRSTMPQRFTLNVTRDAMARWAGRPACACSRPAPAARRSSAMLGGSGGVLPRRRGHRDRRSSRATWSRR